VGVVAAPAPAMAAERPASYATRYRAGSPQQPAGRANGYSRCQMMRSQWRRLWCSDVASSRAGTMCSALPSRVGFCVHMARIDAKQQIHGGMADSLLWWCWLSCQEASLSSRLADVQKRTGGCLQVLGNKPARDTYGSQSVGVIRNLAALHKPIPHA
jgi:hypothetical protein